MFSISTRQNSRFRSRYAAQLWFILPMLFLPPPADAVPVVSFIPEVSIVAPNEDFEVQVWITGSDTISNFQLFVQFDPALIEFVSAEEGDLYLNTTESDINWFFAEEESVGTYQIFYVIFPTMSYVVPPGEMATIQFHSITSGYTALSFLDVNVKDIERFPLDTLTWENGGVYVGDPTIIGEGEHQSNDRWGLGEPYPNPTYGESRIPLRHPGREGDYRLSVYDIRGRLIKVLADPAVRYTATVFWDGVDSRGQEVSSGTYFYRLTTPENTVTRKVFLVR